MTENYVQNKLKDTIEKIKSYTDDYKIMLTDAMTTENGGGVTSNPFFSSNGELEYRDMCPDEEAGELLDDVMNKYSLPIEFKILYTPLPSTAEITVNHFTFRTLSDILSEQYYDNVKLLGVIYHGMGYFVGLYFDIRDKTFFFGLDGGSNGYDRDDNAEFYNTLDINNELVNKFKTNALFDVLETIKENKILDDGNYFVR